MRALLEILGGLTARYKYRFLQIALEHFNLRRRDEYLSLAVEVIIDLHFKIIDFLEKDRLGLSVTGDELNEFIGPFKFFFDDVAMCDKVIFPDDLSLYKLFGYFLRFW